MELAPIWIKCLAADLTHSAFRKYLARSEAEEAAAFFESEKHIALGRKLEAIAETLFFVVTNTHTTAIMRDACGGLQMRQMLGPPARGAFGSGQ